MSRVKTFTNGGSLLPGDLNAIEDDYELAFSTYKNIETRSGITTNPAALTYLGLGLGQGTTDAWTVSANTDLGFQAVFYLDPADFTAGTRTTKYRVRVSHIVNANALGATLTYGLYPVTADTNGQATLGTVIAGSTIAITNQAINTQTQANSGDFTAPAAGYYALGFASGGGANASSKIAIQMRLQMRQV